MPSRRATSWLDAEGSIEPQSDRKRVVEIVVNHCRGGHFIATRQRDRQIEIDEERLEHTKRRLRCAKLSLGRNGAGRDSPRGNRIGQVNFEAPPARFGPYPLGPPEEGSRGPLSNAG